MRLQERIRSLRKEFDGKTQAVRGSLLAELEGHQATASDLARSAKDAKEKRKWMQMAAYLAQTITYIASEYDSSKIVARLEELEKRVNELREKDRQAGKRS